MGKHKLQLYNTLQLKDIELNPTILYNLDPIGLNTVDTESLSSYMLRLADVHFISAGKLLSFINQLDTTINYTSFRSYINGIGKATEVFINTFEKLTGQTNLTGLTLLKFRGIFSFMNLLKQERAWCPTCLHEMSVNNLPIYEKLVWNIKHYDVCGYHQVKLEQECPKCKKMQRIFTNRGKNGYCQHCYSWFGLSKNECKVSNNEHEYFNSKQIEYIITDLSERSSLKEDLIKLFINLNENYLLGNGKKKVCEAKFGVNYGNFNQFCEGVPFKLLFLLKLCFSFEIDLPKFLANKFEFPQNKNNTKKYNHEKDAKKVLDYLCKVLSDKNKIPLQIITNDLGVSINTLNRRFPDIMEAIRKKNRRLSKSKKIDKFIKDNREYEIKQCSEEVVLHQPVTKLPLKLNNNKREIKTDINKIKEILIESLNSIGPEPLTIRKICERLDVSSPTLNNYFPDLLEQIKYRNSEVIKERRSKILSQRKELVINCVRSFHSQGIYPSTRLIEDALPFHLIYNKDLVGVWRSTMKELGLSYKPN